MTDLVAEVLKMEDLGEDATLQKLTGRDGVFVGADDNSIPAAQLRYEAMKAVEKGTATYEQRKLLEDLDMVLQGARSQAAGQTKAVAPQAAPQVTVQAPAPVSVPRNTVTAPRGMPRPPRHSRSRR